MKGKHIRNMVILLILLSSIILVFKTYNVKKAEIVVTEYYRSIQKQDYQDAYKYLSKDTKENISLDEFKEFYRLGNEIKEIKLIDVSEGQKNNGIVTVPVRVNIIYRYEDNGKVLEENFKHKLSAELINYKLILEWSDFNKQLSQTYIDYVWEKHVWRDDIDTKTAVDSINKAIEYDKDNPDIYYISAKIEKENEDALFLLDKSIELAEKRDYWLLSYVYNMKGEILEEQGKLEDARNNFKLAIEEDEQNLIALRRLEEIEELLALNTDSNDKQEIEILKEETEVDNKEVIMTPSDKRYIDKILTISNDYIIGLEKIYELMNNVNSNAENWLIELAVSMLIIENNCDIVDELLAPSKFIEMQKELIEVSNNLRLAMGHLTDMIDNDNISSLDSYEERMAIASRHMKNVIDSANDIKTKYKF